MDDPTWTLVHGYIFGFGVIEHAWLKRGDVAYDAVEHRSYTVEQYKKKFNAQEVATYDVQSACELNAKRGRFDFLPPRPGMPPEVVARLLAHRARTGGAQ